MGSDSTMGPTVALFITPRDSQTGYDRIEIDLPSARVGNVRCHFLGETVIIYSIQVYPEFQRNGYATATIAMLKERFSVIVADRVRFAARGFWQKMGFLPLADGNWEFRQ